MNTNFTGGNAGDGEWPLLRGRVIVLQSLAHAYDVVKGEAEAAVEFDYAVVGSSNLEIDFGAAGGSQEPFRLSNNGARKSAALKPGGNGQVIEPAAMSFVTGHHTRHDLAVQKANQKQIRPDEQFALDVPMR